MTKDEIIAAARQALEACRSAANNSNADDNQLIDSDDSSLQSEQLTSKQLYEEIEEVLIDLEKAAAQSDSAPIDTSSRSGTANTDEQMGYVVRKGEPPPDPDKLFIYEMASDALDNVTRQPGPDGVYSNPYVMDEQARSDYENAEHSFRSTLRAKELLSEMTEKVVLNYYQTKVHKSAKILYYDPAQKLFILNMNVNLYVLVKVHAHFSLEEQPPPPIDDNGEIYRDTCELYSLVFGSRKEELLQQNIQCDIIQLNINTITGKYYTRFIGSEENKLAKTLDQIIEISLQLRKANNHFRTISNQERKEDAKKIDGIVDQLAAWRDRMTSPNNKTF
jgi:hypothetical protein